LVFVFSSFFLITARSELRKVLFLALSATFLFVYEISREPLNGFVKVKGQGHPGQKTTFSDIFRNAERICDKFTLKTCLIPHLDELEGRGQLRRPACGLCLENIFALVSYVFGSTRYRLS